MDALAFRTDALVRSRIIRIVENSSCIFQFFSYNIRINKKEYSMCLRIKKDTKRIQAKRAVKVWKVLLTGSNSAPFHDFIYNKGVNKSLLRRDKRYCCIVFRGLHAWASKKEAGLMRIDGEKIVEAFIPKGAYYYKGSREDIASDTLVIKSMKRV